MATRSKSYAGRAASTNSEEPEPRLTRRRIAAGLPGFEPGRFDLEEPKF